MRKLFLLMLLMISACAAFDPEVIWRTAKLKERLAKEVIVVDRRIHEQQSDAELGFVVFMQSDDAKKTEAPTGAKFIRLLDERVMQEERLTGRKICQHGYKLGSREPFIGERDIWSAGFDCNPN